MLQMHILSILLGLFHNVSHVYLNVMRKVRLQHFSPNNNRSILWWLASFPSLYQSIINCWFAGWHVFLVKVRGLYVT